MTRSEAQQDAKSRDAANGKDATGKLVEIRDFQPGWIMARSVCVNCAKRWVAVMPEEAYEVMAECPRCGKMKGIHLE